MAEREIPKMEETAELYKMVTAIKNINPQNYEGKKTTYSLEELESIIGE